MRLSEEQYAALQAKAHPPVDRTFHDKHRPRPNTALISEAVERKRKPKFSNIRCTAPDGTTFGSRLEMRFYVNTVLPMWKAGELLWYTRQIPFWLEGSVKFIVDFFLVEKPKAGSEVPILRLIDTTGIMTSTKTNKLKQLKARYGLDVEIVTKS